MRTPAQLSPQVLCQELVRDDPWRVLVVCLMLNQTAGVQVRRVFPEFFKRWPTPLDLIVADAAEIKEVIRPLGFQNRRHAMLTSMSDRYIRWDGRNVRTLPGVGPYTADSWAIFVKGEVPDEVQDKELKRYCEWARNLPSSEATTDERSNREGTSRDHDGLRGI